MPGHSASRKGMQQLKYAGCQLVTSFFASKLLAYPPLDVPVLSLLFQKTARFLSFSVKSWKSLAAMVEYNNLGRTILLPALTRFKSFRFCRNLERLLLVPGCCN